MDLDFVRLILKDAKTYKLLNINKNYCERLYEAYLTLKENNISNLEEFDNSNIGIGAFRYDEITIFDRLKDENYASALEAHKQDIKGMEELPKDYGDRLASWGTVGKTPYREDLIKRGYIIKK